MNILNSKNETVCAIVVTYNRKLLLIECLESLLNQTYPIDAIYLIDNASIDGTGEFLESRGYINKKSSNSDTLSITTPIVSVLSKNQENKPTTVYYKRMKENSGGAGGFYEGLKSSFEIGFDWFLLIDDDCLLDKDCIKYLMLNRNKDNILSTNVISANGVPIWRKNQVGGVVEQLPSVAFNGFFSNKNLIEKIGFPIKEFFLYWDDAEFSFRAKKQGFRISLIEEAIVNHPVSFNADIKKPFCIFGKTILYHVEMPSKKLYFYLRNGFVLIYLYSDFALLLRFIRESVSFLAFSSRRIEYMKTLITSFNSSIKLIKVVLKNRWEYKI